MPARIVGAEEPGDSVPSGVCLHQSDLLWVPASQEPYQKGPGALWAQHQHDWWVTCFVIIGATYSFRNNGVVSEKLIQIFILKDFKEYLNSLRLNCLTKWCDFILLIQVLLASALVFSRRSWLSSSLRSKESRRIRGSMRPVPLHHHRPAYLK